MTSRDFCYWLQGLFELQNPRVIDSEKTQLIKRHLAMVFKHEIDPSFPDAKELSAIHNPTDDIGKALEKAQRERKTLRRRNRSIHDTPIMC